MRTKANIRQVVESIRSDIQALDQLKYKFGLGYAEQKEDTMGTLAVNLRVFAGALDEERNGRQDFNSKCLPSELVGTIANKEIS